MGPSWQGAAAWRTTWL
ncbi:hypothetical protein HaLaN_15258, partial [Haematococcus lacustris]